MRSLTANATTINATNAIITIAAFACSSGGLNPGEKP